jgi:hypothetical protein
MSQWQILQAGVPLVVGGNSAVFDDGETPKPGEEGFSRAAVDAYLATLGVGHGANYMGPSPDALEHLPGLTPDEVRANQWQAIKALRDRLSDQGGYRVTVAGVPKWFHSDNKSKIQQLALTMMGASVPPVQWKTMDGRFVTLTQALAGQIFQAAAAQDMALFAAAEAHKAALAQAEDPAAYVFSGGWPATFGG